MRPRQRYALGHPLNDVSNPDLLRALTQDRRHETGVYVRTILAVDR